MSAALLVARLLALHRHDRQGHRRARADAVDQRGPAGSAGAGCPRRWTMAAN